LLISGELHREIMSYTVCRSRSVLLRLISCRDQNELGCRAVSFLQRTFSSSSSDGSHGDDHEVSDDHFDLHPSRHAANRITAPTMPKKMLTDYNAGTRRKVHRHVEKTQKDDPYMSSRRDFESYSNDTGYDLLELERKDPWKREKRIRSDRRTFRQWGETGEYHQGYGGSDRNNRDGTGRTFRTESRGVTGDNQDSPSVIRELLESAGRLEPRSVPQENERRENGNWYNYGLAGPGKKQRAM